jgi:hypothetical protein
VRVAAFLAAAVTVVAAGQQQQQAVLPILNGGPTIRGTEQSKSYKVLFDAYLKLPPPPTPVGEGFNLTTIHPRMHDWQAVADWAESGQGMAEAIIACRRKNILGLPYGENEVPSAYRTAGLTAVVGAGGSLRRTEFPYMAAIEVIAAFTTAEVYRRMEARDTAGALELAVSFNWVLRQLCDREFHREKLPAIWMLTDALATLRDVMYLYQESITPEQFRELSWWDIPALRPGRDRLQIPEGDRIVSEALLEEVFDNRDQADPDLFAATFAAIQSADSPLTRFGAARRWRNIALVHGSLEASKVRLKLIYDDWWRRWRVQEYDPILDIETQFARTNPVRYAAVIYSMEDIEEVFGARNRLVASVNGTALAAGLCAYRRTFAVYPDDKEKLYGQFVRKRITDFDPFDQEYGPLRYALLSRRVSTDTPNGRLWVEAGECALYSLGEDHTDDRAAAHDPEAGADDYVFWPPIRALSREQGLIE